MTTTVAHGSPRRSAAIMLPKSVSSQTIASGRHSAHSAGITAAFSRAIRSAKPSQKSRSSRCTSTGCNGIRFRGRSLGGSVSKTASPRNRSGSSAAGRPANAT